MRKIRIKAKEKTKGDKHVRKQRPSDVIRIFKGRNETKVENETREALI